MLTGGFVGVDVFFVISGFLITTHLLTRPPRRPRDLAAFWARRIRRLLPASLTVLAATALATRVVAPETQWENTAREIQAAATYVLNWDLAGDAVDYSAADKAATPVQHFWSLSVEEQFYLVWPLLIALLAVVATRLGLPLLTSVRAGLLLVVVASLAYSVVHTAHDPAGAYFVTPTRVWELGAGGLLAALAGTRVDRSTASTGSRDLGTLSAGLGLAAIAWSAWTYSSATPFPGWHAAVPVLGAVLVIASGDRLRPRSGVSFLAARPVQRLGDLSYGVYLWHWPLIVLVPHLGDGGLGLLDAVVIVVTTWVLAEATKRLVEDPVRTARGVSLSRTYVAAALGMALVVGMSMAQLAEVGQREQREQARVAAAFGSGEPCFGAAALDDGADCTTSSDQPLVPSPAQAVADRYDTEHRLTKDKKCWAAPPSFEMRTCEFGDPQGDVEVAVVGNSHAAHWMAPLEKIAFERGWRITSFFANRCALSKTDQDFETAEETEGCSDWVDRTTTRIAEGPFDFVVLSNRMSVLPAGETAASAEDDFAAGYETVLREWQDAGRTVIAITDTPWPGATIGPVPACLEAHPGDVGACAGDRDEWLPDDPVDEVVRVLDDPRIQSVDLNDHLCGPDSCPAVVGGVVAYADHSHLTSTYALTLGPYLDRAVTAALRSAR